VIKILTIFVILLAYLAIYMSRLSYLLLIIPSVMFVYILYKQKILYTKLYFLVYLYFTITLLFSLYFNQLNIVLMDAKMLVLLFLFYIFYYLSSSRILKLNDFVIPILFISIIISLVGMSSILFGERLGSRGDFGNSLALLLPLIVYFYTLKLLKTHTLIFLIILNYSALVIMEGRAALIAYSICFILLYVYRRKLNLKINKVIFLLICIFGIFIASKVFLDRAGIDNVNLNREARYIASFIFLNVLEYADFNNILFGFGLGNVYDSYADSVKFDNAIAHVIYIKSSSGVGHYVSWGFHNNIIRLVLMFGIMGSSLFYFWQISLFYTNRIDFSNSEIIKLKALLKIIFLVTLLLSFSNTIYGITLVGAFIFTIQGLIYGEITSQKNILITKNKPGAFI
jgi:hypothetical protein